MQNKYLIPKDIEDPVERLRSSLMTDDDELYFAVSGGFGMRLPKEALAQFEVSSERPSAPSYFGWVYFDDGRIVPARINAMRWNGWADAELSTAYLQSHDGQLFMEESCLAMRDGRVLWPGDDDDPDNEFMQVDDDGWHSFNGMCFNEASREDVIAYVIDNPNFRPVAELVARGLNVIQAAHYLYENADLYATAQK